MPDPPDRCEPPADAARTDAATGRFEPIAYRCEACGRQFRRFAPVCPECGASLDPVLSATYRPRRTTLMRVIAWLILAGTGLALAAAVWALLRTRGG